LNNTKVTDLVVPENVTKLGANIFGGCNSLNSVTIPNDVSFGDGVFRECLNLTSANISCKIIG